jgi:ribonucleoside-diphosphate reductase alpha chain
MSLQYGVPLEVYVNKFSHTRFEPMGHTKNPDIRIAKSLVDYIFRWLGMQFIPGYREAQSNAYTDEPASKEDADSEPKPAAKKVGGQNGSAGKLHSNGNGNGHGAGNGTPVAKRLGASTGPATELTKEAQEALLLRAGVSPKMELYKSVTVRSEQFASFQLDAPACDNCGAITVRNGNCYLCHNCGNSMGCS